MGNGMDDRCFPQDGYGYSLEQFAKVRMENRGELQSTALEQPSCDPIWARDLASFTPYELMVDIHFCERDRV